ncbi:hypothetical protein CFM99_27355 [Klebsiella pneumoniae]|nr:hypothetical protein [Klebsiella pneumoniae]
MASSFISSLNGIRKRISGLCILSVRLPAGELKRALLILPGTFLSDFSSPNYCKRAARTVLTGMCYSVGSATRQGSSSLTRFIGQSAMTSRT